MSSIDQFDPLFSYSVGEEIANSITHALGAALGVAGLVISVAMACRYRTGAVITACSIYGATMVILFAFSALYHAVSSRRAKIFFQKCDHMGIYFLIAGTYTPIALGPLAGWMGWALFAVVWALAIMGAILEVVFAEHREKFAVILSLVMGWMALVVIVPLVKSLSTASLFLLGSGGVAYSVGVIFYRWESLRFGHAIWHLFVLAGCILQFFAILTTIVPR